MKAYSEFSRRKGWLGSGAFEDSRTLSISRLSMIVEEKLLTERRWLIGSSIFMAGSASFQPVAAFRWSFLTPMAWRMGVDRRAAHIGKAPLLHIRRDGVRNRGKGAPGHGPCSSQ
jgi:hypothetical protein